MKKEKPIAYEPHPISPERKAELRGAGFQIIDAIYKPKDAPVAAASATSLTGTGTQTGQGAGGDDDDPPGDLTVKDIKQLLDDAGISYPANAKKAELRAILEGTQA